MNYFRNWGLALALVVTAGTVLSAQKQPAEASKDWMLLDFKKDKVYGMSVKKGYSLLKNKKPTKVIVAVIDSGVDYLHEDLKDVMWTNIKEVPDNGIDDDNNGYIDDIHGWNFIGGKDGKNVEHDNLELTRLYRDLKARFEGKKGPFANADENKLYNQYLSIKADYEDNLKESQTYMPIYEPLYKSAVSLKDGIKQRFNMDNATAAQLDALKLDKSDTLYTKIQTLKKFMSEDLNTLYEDLKGAYDYFYGQVNYNYNLDYDPRSIVGDNYSNSSERFYGNNDVKGPDASHGTHVAGIIGAKRFNNIGIDGVADYIQIMAVRVVPDGDERDKDVANGIRYAVDNGARVINMSFGKAYVKDKKVVDDAVKYAESKGVLIVHAAGNESLNIDEHTHYPTRMMEDGGTVNNWLEVGAMGWQQSPNSVGSFSNYGKTMVDVFAPGVDIYSSIPDNKYAFFDGTSMASPSCAGVAAVIFSYFPNLTAAQVKDIIVNSSAKYPKLKVYKPGTEEEVVFSGLSSSGGVVNLYNAIKMASKIK